MISDRNSQKHITKSKTMLELKIDRYLSLESQKNNKRKKEGILWLSKKRVRLEERSDKAN
jgi:hypothetical protein